MDFEEVPRHQTLVIRPTGVLDAGLSPEFQAILAERHSEELVHLVVDCSGLEMVASSGLQLFLTASRKARLSGGRVILVGVNQPIRGVFKITRLERFFEFEEELSAALFALSQKGPSTD